MRIYRRPLLSALALALTIGGSAPVQAQAYPSRAIRLIVPLAAGSTADIISRTIGAELAKETGQPVVVENKAGAGGTIAMAELAHAAPDGYTIAFASQGTLVFNVVLYAKPGYDSLKDFAPIVLVGGVSNVMVVPPGNPAKTAMDVVAAAKAPAITCRACCSASSPAPSFCTCPTRARRRASWRR